MHAAASTPTPTDGSALFDLERRRVRGIDLGSLYRGPDFSLTRWRCCETGHGKSAEKTQPCHVLVFVHAGCFRQQDPQGDGVADPTQVAFYNADQAYQTSHPHGEGDQGSGIAFSERLARRLLAEVAPDWCERPAERLFPATLAGAPGGLIRRHREVVAFAHRHPQAGPLHRMLIEESVVDTLAGAMASLAAGRAKAKPIDPIGRKARERSLAIQGLLTSNAGAPWCLDDLSAQIGISLFRMCREFRAVTGLSIHQYLLRSRTFAALDRLECDPGVNLTDLALELGFDSHSHFTKCFRQLSGTTPSAYRAMVGRDLSDATLRQAATRVDRAALGHSHPAGAP